MQLFMVLKAKSPLDTNRQKLFQLLFRKKDFKRVDRILKIKCRPLGKDLDDAVHSLS
jgi:hypothetical protein